MREVQHKVAERTPKNVRLTNDEWDLLSALSKAKYGGALKNSAVLRVEGMARVREELARLQSNGARP